MKLCEKSGCSNPCFGKGYCKFHQYLRPDIKEKMLNKPFRRTISIKRMSASTQKRKALLRKDDEVFYLSIWDKRKHECAYCKDPLGDEPANYMFDHILEKSIFKSLRHEEENIVLTCFQCHQVKTLQKYTEKMKVIIYSAVIYFIHFNKLIQIGEVNITRIRDWVKETS